VDRDSQGEKKMLKHMNYPYNDNRNTENKNNSKFKTISNVKKDEIIAKQKRHFPNHGSDNMPDVDFFLTLLLKNLSSEERFLLLNKLLALNWDQPDEDLNNYLQYLISKKKSDEDLKETLEYEYFLWDFNNWKNYFLQQSKKE